MKYIRPQDVMYSDMDRFYSYEAKKIDARTIRIKTGPYSEDITIMGSAASIDEFIARFKERYPNWQLHNN